MLEIGAGEGLFSLWLLARGARRVVSLEPEADGSTAGHRERAERHRRQLNITEDRWEYRPETLQSYGGAEPFRFILSHASINHLDEEACVRLLFDEHARESYCALFAKIRTLLEPRGHLAIVDVARRNLWGWLGMASPWGPEIEWHKHQEPELWCNLLQRAGFDTFKIAWPSPLFRARHLGRVINNRWIARCTGSIFSIRARAAL